ncbi:hypothetical protein JYG30_07435 [Fibrella sp. USSR17]
MKNTARYIQPKFIYTLSFVYLLIPFVLFILFWLKPIYSLFVFPLLIYCLFLGYKNIKGQSFDAYTLTPDQQKSWLIGTGILLLWLCFSGVGNIAYQNFDYDIRNAVLRDLVEQDWPVTYKSTIYPPERQFTQNNLLLVYYFGYWLPAAIVGKLFGLSAANLALLAWTYVGLILIFTLLCQYLAKYSYVVVLLLLVWSGLDIVGTLFASLTSGRVVELNLLSHLERWVNYFDVYAQFSSNTTLLYWVFNQTIPLWLCVLLFINNRNSSYIFLIICLALFQAPIGTLGFLPYVLFRIVQRIRADGLGSVISTYLTVPNTAGAVTVLSVTALFFSMNRAGSMKSIVFFDPAHYALFLFLEVGLLALILYVYTKNNTILFCLAILACIPLIKLGRFYDFGMRASISYLFLLCIITMNFLLDKKASRTGKRVVLIYLAIGAVTPFLEITRSVFFTTSHVSHILYHELAPARSEAEAPALIRPLIKERDFLYDHIKTFSVYNKDIETIVDQYIGESSGNVFADYLLRKPAVSAKKQTAQ